MPIKASLIWVLLVLAVLWPFASAVAADAEQPSIITNVFVIGPYALSAPVDYFVLVRKGGEVGAFRFLSVPQVPGPNGTGKSRYESYMLVAKSGNGTWEAEFPRTGDIDIRELKGFHPFAWQPGQDKLRVGKWVFRCYAPQLVNMSSGSSEKDKGFEFAPTATANVHKLDPTSPRLHWYRISAESSIQVRVDDLARGVQ